TYRRLRRSGLSSGPGTESRPASLSSVIAMLASEKRALLSSALDIRRANTRRTRKNERPRQVSCRGRSLLHGSSRPGLRVLDVDVVADHRAEDPARCRTDETTLELVPAGHRTDDCTGARADGGITTGVLDRRPRGGSGIVAARRPRAAA